MKQISETIDGSIKNVIQLKTLDGSLEWSQMFDALNDCPAEFQNKLVDAINSVAETKDVPATQVFKLVLCGNSDEDVCKKLYNWWRGLFDVLSRCKIPEERVGEYDEKVDALMAEITKAGSDLEMNEEPAVVTEGGEELGYEQADKEDEEEMLQNMEFAIQHIGEIANKVKELVNFVNPYCGTEVNESGDQPKFKVGDVVRVMGVSGMDFYGRDAPIGPIVKIQPSHPDVGVYEYMIKGRSGEFFAYEDELELLPERFTEENDVMGKPGRYGIGDHVLYKGEECVVTDIDEDLRNDEEIYQVSRDSDKVDGLSFNDWVTWDEIEPVEEFTEEVKNTMKFNKIEENRGGDSEWVSMDDIIGKEFEESGEERQMNEAQVVVDANDVWDVLELLDDDVANQNLTELINSHVRTEDEIMDAIENILGASGYSDNVPKAALNGMFSSENIHELIGELGLDVDAYMDRGVIQDAEKPTSVELESVEAEKTKKVSLYVDWDDDGAGIDSNVVIDVPAEIADSEESDALYDYISDWIDKQDFCVNDWMITDIEGLDKVDEGSEDAIKDGEIKDGEKQVTQGGETKTIVAGEENGKKEMSDAEAATIMGGASATDMDAADMGVSSHEVADPYNKKPVCEMTIEQEVDNPWNLAEMLWGQGKENFEELLRSGVVSEDYVMQYLEDTELRNLTNINDAFAYDFESILDDFGCDPEAWSQHLKIVKKGDSVDDDDE